MGFFNRFKQSKNIAQQSIVSENECEQTKIITQEIQEIVFKYNDMFPEKKIDFDNIFVGKCVNNPGCVGCYWKEDRWYLYRVDDRFNLLRNGPFSLNGIIVALLHMLYIPAELHSRKFDSEEHNLYLSGEKPV